MVSWQGKECLARKLNWFIEKQWPFFLSEVVEPGQNNIADWAEKNPFLCAPVLLSSKVRASSSNDDWEGNENKRQCDDHFCVMTKRKEDRIYELHARAPKEVYYSLLLTDWCRYSPSKERLARQKQKKADCRKCFFHFLLTRRSVS